MSSVCNKDIVEAIAADIVKAHPERWGGYGSAIGSYSSPPGKMPTLAMVMTHAQKGRLR